MDVSRPSHRSTGSPGRPPRPRHSSVPFEWENCSPAASWTACACSPQPGQLTRFAAIGVASTVAHLLLFVALRGELGPIGANVVALLLSTVANTAANRRLTFGVRGCTGAVRHQLQGLVVFGLGLGLTTGALALVGARLPGELSALLVANALATMLRFVLFRAWIFRGGPTRRTPAPASQEIAA